MLPATCLQQERIDMTIDEELQDLTSKWFEYVSLDHHKDRDCHFYITLDYKYGGMPIFGIDHYGYVGDEFHAKAHTLDKAKKILKERIEQMILLEGEWVDTVLKNGNDFDSWQVQKANAYKRLFRKDRYEKNKR